MNCKKCNALLPDDAVFCYECGHRIAELGNCYVCGVELIGSGKFCRICGAKQADNIPDIDASSVIQHSGGNDSSADEVSVSEPAEKMSETELLEYWDQVSRMIFFNPDASAQDKAIMLEELELTAEQYPESDWLQVILVRVKFNE